MAGIDKAAQAKAKVAAAKKAMREKKAKGLIHRRRKNNRIRPGMQMGDLYVEKRVNTKQGSSGGQRWGCICSCGKRISVPQWYLIRPDHPKRHCGCQKKVSAHTRERGIWYMMHRRCYNDTHVAFKHYGGADPRIGVCDAWNKDKVGVDKAWENFIRDMGPAPTKGHTLDRINPYKWYQPDNCRWATHTEQMNNLKRHWKKPETLAEIAKAEAFSDVGGNEDVNPDADDDDDDEGEE